MTPSKIPGWLAVPAAGLVLLARMPDRFFHPQFYAEDAYFYECALARGAKSLLLPYGGYLLTLQRAAAWFATALAPLRVPFFFNAVALLLALAVLAQLFSPRIDLGHKPLLALAVVLIPRAEDIFLVFENVQWIMALGLVLLLVSADARRAGARARDRAEAVIFGLTGVFSVVLLPLFVLRALRRKTRESAVLAALLGATALIQFSFVLTAPPHGVDPAARFDLGQVPAIFGFRVFAHLFGGDQLLGLSDFALGLAGVLGLIWLARAGGAPEWSEAQRANRRDFFAAICLLAAASIYRFKDQLGMFLTPEHLERYFFVPQVLCLWLILAELSRGPVRRGLALGLFAVFLATSASSFRIEPLPDLHWERYAPLVRGDHPVNIPTNPAGWHFHYPGNEKE